MRCVIGTPTRLEVYRMVVENPLDDTCRLVYADWLDDHGDRPDDKDRARLIRLQHDYGVTGSLRDARAIGNSEIHNLLYRHKTQWIAPFVSQFDVPLDGCRDNEGVMNYQFFGTHYCHRRGQSEIRYEFEVGFLAHLELTWEEWHTYHRRILWPMRPSSEQLFSEQYVPLRKVHLKTVPLVGWSSQRNWNDTRDCQFLTPEGGDPTRRTYYPFRPVPHLIAPEHAIVRILVALFEHYWPQVDVAVKDDVLASTNWDMYLSRCDGELQ